MWARAAWAALGLFLPRVVRVWGNIARVFLVAIVVFFAATQSPSAMGWGKSCEETRNVVVSKGVGITNKSLTEDAAVLPSLWIEQFPNLYKQTRDLNR